MERKFKDIIDKQFSDLLYEFYQLEAELKKLKCVSKQTYQYLLKEKEYEQLEKLIAIMFKTSQSQNDTFKRIHRACIELIKKASSGNKKKVNELIAMIKEAEKQGITYAERLSFSIGQGWTHSGEISTFRRIINIPGYLLIAPFLGREKRDAMYGKSLYDLRRVVEEAKQNKDEHGFKPKDRKELEKVMKDFKIFIRITNKLHRNFSKLRNRCRRIYKDIDDEIDEDKVYLKDDADFQWAP